MVGEKEWRPENVHDNETDLIRSKLIETPSQMHTEESLSEETVNGQGVYFFFG